MEKERDAQHEVVSLDVSATLPAVEKRDEVARFVVSSDFVRFTFMCEHCSLSFIVRNGWENLQTHLPLDQGEVSDRRFSSQSCLPRPM